MADKVEMQIVKEEKARIERRKLKEAEFLDQYKNIFKNGQERKDA